MVRADQGAGAKPHPRGAPPQRLRRQEVSVFLAFIHVCRHVIVFQQGLPACVLSMHVCVSRSLCLFPSYNLPLRQHQQHNKPNPKIGAQSSLWSSSCGATSPAAPAPPSGPTTPRVCAFWVTIEEAWIDSNGDGAIRHSHWTADNNFPQSSIAQPCTNPPPWLLSFISSYMWT